MEKFLTVKLHWNNTLVLDAKAKAGIATEIVNNFITSNFIIQAPRKFTPITLDAVWALMINPKAAPIGGTYQDETGEAIYYIGQGESI